MGDAFLKFQEHSNQKRIAYAASFGTDDWEYTEEETAECARLLKKFDAVLKLAIVYMLSIGNTDKLVLWATLLCLLQVGIIIFYRIYCIRYFPEARFRFGIDKKIFKDIAGFSGWQLFANGSITLNSQGILILLNMFSHRLFSLPEPSLFR